MHNPEAGHLSPSAAPENVGAAFASKQPHEETYDAVPTPPNIEKHLENEGLEDYYVFTLNYETPEVSLFSRPDWFDFSKLDREFRRLNRPLKKAGKLFAAAAGVTAAHVKIQGHIEGEVMSMRISGPRISTDPAKKARVANIIDQLRRACTLLSPGGASDLGARSDEGKHIDAGTLGELPQPVIDLAHEMTTYGVKLTTTYSETPFADGPPSMSPCDSFTKEPALPGEGIRGPSGTYPDLLKIIAEVISMNLTGQKCILRRDGAGCQTPATIASSDELPTLLGILALTRLHAVLEVQAYRFDKSEPHKSEPRYVVRAIKELIDQNTEGRLRYVKACVDKLLSLFRPQVMGTA